MNHLNLSIAFLFNTVLLVELIDTAVSSCGLLLTCVERMALGANFYVKLRLGGSGYERVAAVAGNRRLIVRGMDSFFHLFHLSMITCIKFLFSSSLLMEPQTAKVLYHKRVSHAS